MRARHPNPTHVLSGAAMLACWLGWTLAAMAALDTRPRADATEVATLLRRLRPELAAWPPQHPLLLRLRDPACRCAEGNDDWNALLRALAGQGGSHRSVSIRDAGFEVLLLDAAGTPVYAGPLAPPAQLCGGRGDLAGVLPLLLDGRLPPLFLPPDCLC